MLVRAMIAAAKADGHIDDDERRKIADRLSLAGIGAEAEQLPDGGTRAPLDSTRWSLRRQTEEQRVEIYTASRLAIDPDTRAERGYLDLLAGRLQPAGRAGRPCRGDGVGGQGRQCRRTIAYAVRQAAGSVW